MTPAPSTPKTYRVSLERNGWPFTWITAAAGDDDAVQRAREAFHNQESVQAFEAFNASVKLVQLERLT